MNHKPDNLRNNNDFDSRAPTQSPPSGPKCIIIAGPTASGKTSLSVELALALDGEIINADSMQVYRGMDIGTAKPTSEEQRGVPHHLLSVVDPDEEFNAETYRSMALSFVRDIVSRQKACLVAGGTGLYIKALVSGLFQCPPADPELRESLRNECNTHGTMTLYEKLKRRSASSITYYGHAQEFLIPEIWWQSAFLKITAFPIFKCRHAYKSSCTGGNRRILLGCFLDCTTI